MNTLTRRQWLKGAMAGIVSLQFGGCGIAGADSKRIPGMGVQLYSARKLMEQDVAKTLAMTAATGYHNVELAGLFNHSAKEFRNMLDNAGLRAPANHVPLAAMQENIAAVIDDAATLGNDYIVLPYLMPEQRKSLDDYKRVIELLNKTAELAKKAGMRMAYHNHDFEFQMLEGQKPYDLLLQQTDPDMVFFEMDLYWVKKAQHDPIALIKANPGRFLLWHLKDMAEDGSFANVGAGIMDFQSLFDVADVSGLEYGFVEHDTTSNPEETFREAWQTLHSLNPPRV